MTSILNGTRFLFIELLPDGKSLPRFNYCAGIHCKIFHFGQPKNTGILLCTNCWKTDHTLGLNAPQKHVVKYANNQVTPQDKRHVPTVNHRRI